MPDPVIVDRDDELLAGCEHCDEGWVLVWEKRDGRWLKRRERCGNCGGVKLTEKPCGKCGWPNDYFTSPPAVIPAVPPVDVPALLREKAAWIRAEVVPGYARALGDENAKLAMQHADLLDLLAAAYEALKAAPHDHGCSGEFGPTYRCKCDRNALFSRIEEAAK